MENTKVLLMGRSGAGKSSMRNMIFNNYVAKDVRRLPTTMSVESSSFKFLGSLTLNIWDCGGYGYPRFPSLFSSQLLFVKIPCIHLDNSRLC